MAERREDPMRLWVGNWTPESAAPGKDKPKYPKKVAAVKPRRPVVVHTSIGRRSPQVRKKSA